jgi:hypothetical protein
MGIQVVSGHAVCQSLAIREQQLFHEYVLSFMHLSCQMCNE